MYWPDGAVRQTRNGPDMVRTSAEERERIGGGAVRRRRRRFSIENTSINGRWNVGDKICGGVENV